MDSEEQLQGLAATVSGGDATDTGVLLMKNVTRAEAIEQLEPGIYLIGHEKVIIK